MPDLFTPQDPWPCRFNCDVSTASPTATGLAVEFASDVLHALTGRQFGLTTVTLRPVRWYLRDTPFPDAWIAMPGAMAPPLGASPYGAWYGWEAPDLSCGSSTEAHLPAPVYSVTEVKVDGAVLSSTAYRVDDNRILRRIDGGIWPTWNDLRRNDTEAGTWAVTAKFGTPVPSGAELAVGELACEYLRALDGNDCRLPKNLTSIARQGITITLPDISESYKKGLTGLRLTDMFILTWNPGHLKARARTYSVDTALPTRAGT